MSSGGFGIVGGWAARGTEEGGRQGAHNKVADNGADRETNAGTNIETLLRRVNL